MTTIIVTSLGGLSLAPLPNSQRVRLHRLRQERDRTTVRNYVNRLIEEGIVLVVGDDPQHDGRGA